VTDPMGVKTKFTYDENGNVLTMSTPNSDTRQVQTYAWTYDDVAHQGDMTSSIDPLGNETDFTYDSHGNLASVTDPLGNTWTYSTKKACFNKTDPRVAPRGGGSTADATITDPLGHTTSFTCDANGNLLTTTDATGATTTNTYDADDELVSTTDPAGRMKKFFYTGTGRISAVRMPDGSTSHATYGADGELLTTVDPAGGTRSFTYDALGRTATDTDQLGRKTTFAYDAVGNLTSTTDAAGVTSTNTYDADNRVLKTRFENGDIPTENDFVYDLDGRRISMTDATGTTTYQYDSLGQLTLQRLGGDIVVHGYDLAGNRTSLQYANGHTVTTQYDGNGQMTRATDWLGNTTKFQYDDAARLIGLKVYDATKTYTVGDTAVYNTSLYRNAANQIIHIQARDAYGNAVASFDYTRAPDGAITSAESTGLGDPHHAYDYDLRARLGSYDGSPVTFDSRNNVTRLPDGSTLSYDAADQLTSMQSPVLLSTFTQDADGNRTASSSPGSVHSYGWNSAGDLTSFTSNGATTTYVLNGDGLRIQAQAPNGTHHTLVWDSAHDLGHNFGCSHDSTGNPACGRGIITNSGTGGGPPRLLTDGTNSFIYGPGGMPIEQIDNNGNALFLGTDAQGSVRLLTDASGNVKGTASYDAFGNRSSMAGESSAFGYHGMYLDSESGLYAFSGGVYDPATGQSISKTKLTASEITHLLGQNSQSLRKFGDCWNCTPLPTASQNSQSLRKFGDCWNCTPIVTAGQNGQSLRSGYYFSTNPSQNSQSLRALSPYAVDGGDPVNGSVGAADVYFNPKEYTIDK